MSRCFATQDGSCFEIRDRRLYYSGPVPPESRHLQAFEYASWLFAWYIKEYPLPEDDQALVQNFASLLGARLVEKPAKAVKV